MTKRWSPLVALPQLHAVREHPIPTPVRFEAASMLGGHSTWNGQVVLL